MQKLYQGLFFSRDLRTVFHPKPLLNFSKISQGGLEILIRKHLAFLHLFSQFRSVALSL